MSSDSPNAAKRVPVLCLLTMRQFSFFSAEQREPSSWTGPYATLMVPILVNYFFLAKTKIPRGIQASNQETGRNHTVISIKANITVRGSRKIGRSCDLNE